MSVAGTTIAWVPEKTPTKEGTGQKPSKRFTVMKFWQFSCIFRHSYVSQFLKVTSRQENWRQFMGTARQP